MKKRLEKTSIEERLRRLEDFCLKQEDINKRIENIIHKQEDLNSKIDILIGKTQVLETYLARIVIAVITSILIQMALKLEIWS